MLRIVQASSKVHVNQVRTLFAEYSHSLDFDLTFQHFEKELSELPGEYALPDGRLLMAIHDGEVAGCVALRRISRDLCEMKRLYVRPGFRGKGVGRTLVTRVIEEAREIGYKKMLLDTVPSMKEAIGLYSSMGFRETGPYRYNPVNGAKFMELTLGPVGSATSETSGSE